jgi:nucleoside-diphosphate-sugar epimerase
MDSPQFMKIAIPGGTGFIGGVLSRRLINHGHAVEVWSRRENKGINLRNLEIIPLDQQTSRILVPSDTDAVVYLSGISAPNALTQTQEMFHLNVFAASHLLSNFVSPSNAVFVYASSKHVDKLLSGELTEDLKENEALRLYATSKLAAETILTQISSEIQKNLAVLRLSNCFGAPDLEIGSDTPGAINDFCRQAISSGTIRLHSAGSVKRIFLPVNSCVDMIIAKLNGAKDVQSEVSAYGESEELTLGEAAELCRYFSESATNIPVSIEIQGKVIERNESVVDSLLEKISAEFALELKNLITHYVELNG